MMRHFFAGSLLLLGLVLIGCNRENAPKGDEGKKDNQVAQDGGKKENPDSGKKKDSKGDDSKKDGDSSEKLKGRKPDYVLTAENLITEWEKNMDGIKTSSTFLTKYDGKAIELTGKVWTVNRKGFTLEGASVGQYLDIECLPTEMEKSYRFSTGQKVKVLCAGKNMGDTFFALQDAKVTELESSKIQRVSAETLAMEWDKSHEFDLEFGKKYGVRWIVSGKVVDTPKKTAVDSYEVTVKGSQKTNLIARITAENDQNLPKKGEVIEFAAGTFVNAKNSSLRTKDANISCFAVLLSGK